MSGSTTTFAFPYPTGTDRVMDGRQRHPALAERVAPSGGARFPGSLTGARGISG
jgi:hypothetical protein